MITTTAVWRDLLTALLQRGQEISPESLGADWRGRTNKELLGYQTTVPMTQPVVLCPGRKLGYRFMAAEAANILAGDNRLSSIASFAPQMTRLSEDGLTMSGHYGPPFRDQLSYVLNALTKDPGSRQAVCQLWRPRPALGGEIPCTLQLQWIVRSDKLYCLAGMRSSDSWMGLVYDWHAFSMMSAYVALALRPKLGALHLGTLTVTAGSQHLYKLDWDLAAACAARDDKVLTLAPLNLNELSTPDDLIAHLWAVARRRPEDLIGNWLTETMS